MEGPELVARQLVARRGRDLGRLDRAGPEHGEVLEHDLQVRIVLDKLGDVGHRAFAVVAVVVEELDERRGRVRIADRRLIFRAEQRPGLARDDLLALGLRGRLVVLVERLDRVRENVRVVDQVVADERAELLLLRGRELVGARGQGGRERSAGEGGGEAEGGKILHAKLQVPGARDPRGRHPIAGP